MAKIAFIGLGNMGGPMAANLGKGPGHQRDRLSTLCRRSKDAAQGGDEGGAQGRLRSPRR
jgi:3-hydroxyisobutyrate dehydrogenase-like beta-hydroxyacid dehydrogenase